MLGGRTNHYGRISLRMGPYDFKPYTRDGKGFDWPISYDDLAPYYDKAEELIGVFGSAEHLENTPDGKFLPPPAPRRPRPCAASRGSGRPSSSSTATTSRGTRWRSSSAASWPASTRPLPGSRFSLRYAPVAARRSRAGRRRGTR